MTVEPDKTKQTKQTKRAKNDGTYSDLALDAMEANVDEPKLMKRDSSRAGGLIVRVGHLESRKGVFFFPLSKEATERLIIEYEVSNPFLLMMMAVQC